MAVDDILNAPQASDDVTVEYEAPLANTTDPPMENIESVAEVSETDSHICDIQQSETNR